MLKKQRTLMYEQEQKHEKAYQRAFSLFFYCCLLIGFLGFSFSTQYLDVAVNGPSMQPTINQQWSIVEPENRDVVFINFKASYKKNDIIVVQHEDDFIIKRIIATGGDTLSIVKNQFDEVEVYVNEVKLVEDYVVYKDGLETTFQNFENLKLTHPQLFAGNVMQIPQNQLFYMGDNRARSQDCSVYGPVDETFVVGKVSIHIPYGKSFIDVLFETLINWF
jgi:signal peptidase I